MEPYTVCKNCGEKTSTNFMYCQKCGSELSFMKKSPSSFQEASPPSGGQEQTTLPQLSTSSPDKSKIELGVNIIYIVLTLGLLAAIWGMFTDQRLESSDHPILLLGLSLLIALAAWRAWFVLQLDPPPPDAYPEGYKTLNTIVGTFIIPLFFVLLPYMFFLPFIGEFLTLGLCILITVIFIISIFIHSYVEKKQASRRLVYQEKDTELKMAPLAESSSHFTDGLSSPLYTMEISKERGSSFWGTGLERTEELIVLDQRDEVCFKLVGGPHRYTIYDAQNAELGELITRGFKGGSIKEKETGLERIINFNFRNLDINIKDLIFHKEKAKKLFHRSLGLTVTTPSGKYFLSDRIVSDQAFSYILSDSQTGSQVLSFERPRQSGKGKIWGILLNFGQLNPLSSCSLGVLLGQNPIFAMNSNVKLLDKSTEIKIEIRTRARLASLRETRLGQAFFSFKDDIGREVFRGIRRGSSYVFTDPLGASIGQISCKRRSSEWVITDSQQEITGTLDLSGIMTVESGDKPSKRLVVGNETFSFGNFTGFIRELYDRSGNLCFAIFGYNALFTLDIKKRLSPNFWCFLSVCLIMECYRKNYGLFVPRKVSSD